MNSLTSNFKLIKEEYEKKFQVFEKLLISSSVTIENLQKSIKESNLKPKEANDKKNDEIKIAELKKELAKKQEILTKFKQGVNLSNEKCTEVCQTLEKILLSKEKIVQERKNDD